MEKFICKYCGKLCKNRNSLAQHEKRCKANPNRINVVIKNFNSVGRTAWNKGLDKSDARVAKQAKSVSQTLKGKPTHSQSAETRAKLSLIRKKYLEEHPEKVPFKLNHSSHESYPEKYFRRWLTKNKLLDKQELQVSRYTLDFAWEDKKIYLEIDGSQHSLAWMQDHDKIRTKYLSNLGWTCIHRVYWPDYQKLNKHQRHAYLTKLKLLIIK